MEISNFKAQGNVLDTSDYGRKVLVEIYKLENWIQEGKVLFGKVNAASHLLLSHMESVLERNLDCFEVISDTVGSPELPSKEVFCICRRVESGMMIQCETCFEWYHGKCLKIARGKIKDNYKYTCPICDWRLIIPRDAVRPRLENLLQWQTEIKSLPFQPTEEEVLSNMITNAQRFRDFLMPQMKRFEKEDVSIIRHYLQKLEGAEVLLAYEWNFLRQELHRLSPVVPKLLPVLEAKRPKMIIELQFGEKRRHLLANIMRIESNPKSIRSPEPDHEYHGIALDTRQALYLRAPPPRNTVSAFPPTTFSGSSYTQLQTTAPDSVKNHDIQGSDIKKLKKMNLRDYNCRFLR